MLHDVFICHASEDKDDVARPLAERLRAHHLAVWYDEFSLSVGDSLREAIDNGLATSRFGIVVLSPSFFQKRWTQRELNGLVAREMAEGRHLILPVWHNITHAEIVQHSPPMADLFALKTSDGLERVAAELVKILRPEASPLIVARDILLKMDVVPPVVTDEWWLDVVEFKEGVLRSPYSNMGEWRWIFPLPHPTDDFGKNRGVNLAWAALQRDWVHDGQDRELCQLTHPDILHDYLDTWPGFREYAAANPAVLSMYAPQLTIPGFDTGLEKAFDSLLPASRSDAYAPNFYSNPDTVDGKDALCGELIAWRHPTFGNYSDHELAYSFVNAHDNEYYRSRHDAFTCLTWLLADASDWMPTVLREYLIAGFARREVWYDMNRGGPFHRALWTNTRGRFRFTRTIRKALDETIAKSLNQIGCAEDPHAIAERFIDHDFVGSYYRWKDEMRAMQRRK